MIQHDDYKRIKKETGLKPSEWLALQAKDRLKQKQYHCLPSALGVYSCRCRSVWCEDCAPTSSTNEMIREKMLEMSWRKVRHVILTVTRSLPASVMFFAVRKNKAIWRLLRSLSLPGQYLWVLEFHRGGHPHWHLFVESESGMIGKTRISGQWKYGHVWESYIKDESHWRSIVGYHKKKGYLAGEKKAHQLELPDYLLETSRCRKYGSNIKTNPSTKAREQVAQKLHNAKNMPEKKKRKKSEPYQVRFASCDSESIVFSPTTGGRMVVPVPGREVREVFRSACRDEISPTLYLFDDEESAFAALRSVTK